ncbi:MAG: hypothetical protein JO189_29395 [Deltaproteobacteria bacterium]|nr:hypothetical protein [Deltaproteobacteria bacterium]
MKKRRPSRKQAAIFFVIARRFMLVFLFAAISVSSAFARAWSYHYKPTISNPSPAASATEASITQATPAPAEQLSTALLLKRTIVSDLALFTQAHTVRSDKAYMDLSEYVVHRL